MVRSQTDREISNHFFSSSDQPGLTDGFINQVGRKWTWLERKTNEKSGKTCAVQRWWVTIGETLEMFTSRFGFFAFAGETTVSTTLGNCFLSPFFLFCLMSSSGLVVALVFRLALFPVMFCRYFFKELFFSLMFIFVLLSPILLWKRRFGRNDFPFFCCGLWSLILRILPTNTVLVLSISLNGLRHGKGF